MKIITAGEWFSRNQLNTSERISSALNEVSKEIKLSKLTGTIYLFDSFSEADKHKAPAENKLIPICTLIKIDKGLL